MSAAQLGEIYPEVSKEELAEALDHLVRDFNSLQDAVELKSRRRGEAKEPVGKENSLGTRLDRG